MSAETQYIQITNGTGTTIKNGVVTHVTTTPEYGAQSVQIENLANGASTTAAAFTTGPSSTDYWYISWTTDGVNYLTWAGHEGIHDHTNQATPGVITLVGGMYVQNGTVYPLGSPLVVFVIDGTDVNKQSVTSPW